MEDRTFWWLKKSSKQKQIPSDAEVSPSSLMNLDILNSLSHLLEDKQITNTETNVTVEVDIESIIEEINSVAARSPLGPYEKGPPEERSVEEIMKEAERIYMESSKSFEQLSSRSKTSLNISDLRSHTSKRSSLTPKSVSPLPYDTDALNNDEEEINSNNSDSLSYTEDFSDEFPIPTHVDKAGEEIRDENVIISDQIIKSKAHIQEDILRKKNIIETLEEENQQLKKEIEAVKAQLQDTKLLLEQTRKDLNSEEKKSPSVSLELKNALIDLEDTREAYTDLQLQLDSLNKTHELLKQSYDEVLHSNKNLEQRVVDLNATLTKCKEELLNIKYERDKLAENEMSLEKLLEIEKVQTKSFKMQNEKDARCIQDLNRQIKEMERIIARKHPDSVSALIVAAKSDACESNLTARKLLEDRIKTLEHEAVMRDTQSSKVFLEVQEKFSQMKLKYENHIEDLELHVSDLKNQLKRKIDTYDVYTQTFFGDQKIPEKETANKCIQTEGMMSLKTQKKEETHLLTTIRGLQADLSNKEKSITKLNKELDDIKKTNRRLQKEREGSLKNFSEKREFKHYPLQNRRVNSVDDLNNRLERDKMKLEVCKIEADYQNLKAKRLHDLNALQEAHEQEIASYAATITPLREQVEVQQVSLAALQTQLGNAKEELAIITVERDHLNNCLNRNEPLSSLSSSNNANSSDDHLKSLYTKIAYLEKRYEERECRLRAIVHGLAQKNITNRSCEQCSARQQQLVNYKTELDQILATLRTL